MGSLNLLCKYLKVTVIIVEVLQLFQLNLRSNHYVLCVQLVKLKNQVSHAIIVHHLQVLSHILTRVFIIEKETVIIFGSGLLLLNEVVSLKPYRGIYFLHYKQIEILRVYGV